MNFTVQQGQDEPWPEGVIARYLTVGGATVDIHETGPRDAVNLQTTIATCLGCGEAEDMPWEATLYDYSDQPHELSRTESVERAEAQARHWAQSHAEFCRAMPRPTT